MILPLTVPAGQSAEARDIYGFRNASAPRGATARTNESQNWDLGASFRIVYGAFRKAVFTAPPASDLLVEVATEPGDDLGGPAAASPSGSGSFASSSVGPGGVATQAQNSAANAPTQPTDGVSLAGVLGLRVVVAAPAGQTLTGTGTVRLWQYDAARARWVLGRIEYAVDLAGVRDLIFPDEAVRVPNGRVYAEALTVATSGGGALTVTVETWG